MVSDRLGKTTPFLELFNHFGLLPSLRPQMTPSLRLRGTPELLTEWATPGSWPTARGGQLSAFSPDKHLGKMISSWSCLRMSSALFKVTRFSSLKWHKRAPFLKAQFLGVKTEWNKMRCVIHYENPGPGIKKRAVREISALLFSHPVLFSPIFDQSCFDSDAVGRFTFYFYSPSFSRKNDKAKFCPKTGGKGCREWKKREGASIPHSCVTEHEVYIWVFSCPDPRWGCETQFKGTRVLLLVMLFFLAWTF